MQPQVLRPSPSTLRKIPSRQKEDELKNAEKIKARITRDSRARQYRPSVQVRTRLSVL